MPMPLKRSLFAPRPVALRVPDGFFATAFFFGAGFGFGAAFFTTCGGGGARRGEENMAVQGAGGWRRRRQPVAGSCGKEMVCVVGFFAALEA